MLIRASSAAALLVMIGCATGMPTAVPTPPPVVRTPPPSMGVCGVERWAVKTLTDVDARRIDLAPVSTTITALAALPPHCGQGPDNARAYPEELQVFEVVGRVMVVRVEDDHDYHVALVDPADPASTIVTEVADPTCAGDDAPAFSRFMLQAGRNSFVAFVAGRSLSSLVGELVVVRGVGFYDTNHGQTGRSASCIELHPVLGIAKAPTGSEVRPSTPADVEGGSS
jgi:hypothetical protein